MAPTEKTSDCSVAAPPAFTSGARQVCSSTGSTPMPSCPTSALATPNSATFTTPFWPIQTASGRSAPCGAPSPCSSAASSASHTLWMTWAAPRSDTGLPPRAFRHAASVCPSIHSKASTWAPSAMPRPKVVATFGCRILVAARTDALSACCTPGVMCVRRKTRSAIARCVLVSFAR
jgi:hypothetical protein